MLPIVSFHSNSLGHLKKKSYFLFLLLFLGTWVFYAQKTPFNAKVISIKDGDTFTVLYQKKEITIRLAHIDSPERKQPFGTKAKQFASQLCFGKEVTILPNPKKDRNGRLIGEVWIGKTCVNKALVKNGLAWHFKRYSKSIEYATLENQARNQKKGLWSEKNPIAPWDWRKEKKFKNYLYRN